MLRFRFISEEEAKGEVDNRKSELKHKRNAVD